MSYAKPDKKLSLWITNFEKKSVSINDLNIRLQPNQSLDVFNSRHVTHEQIVQSMEKGDLFKSKLYKSQGPIEINVIQLKLYNKPVPRPSVSAVKIERKNFAELEEIISNEAFDKLSDEQKKDLEQKILTKKEDDLISQMFEEEK